MTRGEALVLALMGELQGKGVLSDSDCRIIMDHAGKLLEADAAEVREQRIQGLMRMTKCTREMAEKAV